MVACVSDLLSMYLVGMHLHAIISEHVHAVIRKNILSGMYNEKQSAALYHARNCTLTTSRQLNMFVWLFVCVFGVYRPTQEFFTHTCIETSPLPVKVCKVWLMLGTHGHWAVRVLYRATPTVTRDIRLLRSSPRTCDTLTYCRAFGSGAVTNLGVSHPGVKPQSPAHEANALPLGIRGGKLNM